MNEATWREPDLTCGEWATEKDAEIALDSHIFAAGCFQEPHAQVNGRPLLMAPTNDAKDFRIDRVVLPTKAAKSAGWTLGPIGIECKRSGEKLGRPVSQMLDYRNAAYRLKDSDTWFLLNWVFLWPAMPLGGPLASVMAQNRVGTVHADNWGTLHFNAGGHTVATAGLTGFDVRPCADRMGRKVGSR